MPDVRDECTDLLETLGVKVHLRGSLPHGPCLLLANHLSYLDIPILATLAPIRFVTSYEVRDSPITGTIAKLGHSIFVERRNYSTLIADIKTMTDCLRAGENIGLFPEATTSSGKMLPWKSSLVECAMRVPLVHVVPVAIQYLEVNDQMITKDNRDLVYYYGGMDFKTHFQNLLDVKSIKVRVTILRPVQGWSRKRLTEKARHAVSVALDR